MKINLNVLMLGLLIGCTSFSMNANWGKAALAKALAVVAVYDYVAKKDNWKAHPYYFAAGTGAVVAATAGVGYLVYKKMQAKKAKAKVEVIVAE